MVSWLLLGTGPSQTSQFKHWSFTDGALHWLVSLLSSWNGPIWTSLSACRSSWHQSTNYVSQSLMSLSVFLSRVLPPNTITYTKGQSPVVHCCMVRWLASHWKVDQLLAISQQKCVALWSMFEVGHRAAYHLLLVQLLYKHHKCRLASQSVHLLWAPHWVLSFVVGFLLSLKERFEHWAHGGIRHCDSEWIIRWWVYWCALSMMHKS